MTRCLFLKTSTGTEKTGIGAINPNMITFVKVWNVFLVVEGYRVFSFCQQREKVLLSFFDSK